MQHVEQRHRHFPHAVLKGPEADVPLPAAPFEHSCCLEQAEEKVCQKTEISGVMC